MLALGPPWPGRYLGEIDERMGAFRRHRAMAHVIPFLVLFGATAPEPSWVSTHSYYVAEGDQIYLYAVGSVSDLKNLALARTTAGNRARHEICKVAEGVEVTMKPAVTAWNQLSAYADCRLSGVEIARYYARESGEVLALARYRMPPSPGLAADARRPPRSGWWQQEVAEVEVEGRRLVFAIGSAEAGTTLARNDSVGMARASLCRHLWMSYQPVGPAGALETTLLDHGCHLRGSVVTHQKVVGERLFSLASAWVPATWRPTDELSGNDLDALRKVASHPGTGMATRAAWILARVGTAEDLSFAIREDETLPGPAIDAMAQALGAHGDVATEGQWTRLLDAQRLERRLALVRALYVGGFELPPARIEMLDRLILDAADRWALFDSVSFAPRGRPDSLVVDPSARLPPGPGSYRFT